MTKEETQETITRGKGLGGGDNRTGGIPEDKVNYE